MLPTNLNKKITFLEKPKSVGVFGSTLGEVVYKCYANLLTTSGSEVTTAYSKDAQIIYSFRVYNTKFTRELPFKTTQYQILYQNQIFDIMFAMVDKSGNYIDIKCQAIVR